MAIEKVIDVKVNGKDAEKNLDNITKKINEQKQITIEFERELKRLEKQLRDTPKNALAEQRDLTQRITHMKDAIVDQNLSLKQLNHEKTVAVQEQKQFSQATKESSKEMSVLTSTVDRYTGGAISGFKRVTAGVGSLSLGFKGLGAAIAATGIGALVIVIGSLIAAFKTSEEGQNRWAKVLGIVGSVVGNFVDLLADLGEKLIWAVTNPKQAWDGFVDALNKGYQFIKGQVVDRMIANWDILSGTFQAGVLSMRIAWNDFIGDGEKAEELRTELQGVNDKVNEAKDVIEEKNQEIIDGYSRAKDAVNEFIDELEEEAKAAAKVADMRAKADLIERDLLVERSKLESQIAELKLKSRLEDEYSAKQRAQFLKDAQGLEEQLIDKEKEALELRRDAQILENSFARSTKENLDAEAQAKAAGNNTEARRLNQQRQTQRELNRLNNEVARNAKQLRDEERKSIEEDNKKLAEQRKELNDKIEELENEYLTSQLDKQTQEENAVREKYFAIIEMARAAGEETLLLEEAQQMALQEIRDRYEQERLDKLQSFRDKFIEQQELDLEQQREQALSELELLTTTEEEKLQAIAEINEYYRQLQKDKDKEDLEDLQAIEAAKQATRVQALNDLINIAGQETKVGQALLIAKQGLALKELVMQATKTISFAKLSAAESIVAIQSGAAQTAKVGFPQNIPLLIGYAAQAAGILSSIKGAVSGAKNVANSFGASGGGASGGASGGERPSASFNLVGDRGGVSQLGLQGQPEQEPIKSYVVSGEVSTAMELERNAVSDAGF